MTRDQNIVYQSLLDEHSGNLRSAFIDLCGRFAYVVNGTSWGAIRAEPIDESLQPESPPARPLDVDPSVCPHG